MTTLATHKKVQTPLELYFFDEINLENQKLFMQAVMRACSISRDTFYKRLKTPHKFSQVEKQFIASLANKPIDKIF